MDRYARMLLHFLHAITNDRHRVHVLTFGTRLTNITRHLRHRDVDVALGRVADAVEDWAGGTRIGRCLTEFNRHWSRRLLGQNAVVLLISDGLDADAGDGLAFEAERLAKSCARLVWLNPLLRYSGFEARPAGIRALLPHVDDFLPVHNLETLTDLAKALAEPRPRGHRRSRMAADAPLNESSMELSNTRIVPAPPPVVWAALNDPAVLKDLPARMRVARAQRRQCVRRRDGGARRSGFGALQRTHDDDRHRSADCATRCTSKGRAARRGSRAARRA